MTGCMTEESQNMHHGWLYEMAWAVKGLAPNQLVASGTEGFFSPGSGYEQYNPGAGECNPGYEQ